MVLLVMSMHATRDGFVGIPRGILAQLCAMSERSVRDALEELENMKELKLVRKGGGKGKHALYRIWVAAIKRVEVKKYHISVVEESPEIPFPKLRLMEDEPEYYTGPHTPPV